MNRKIGTVCAYLLVLVIGIVGAAQIASASSTAPPIFYTLQNDYIKLDWGVGNTVDFTIGTVVYSWDVAGRFSVQTTGGDPETTQDNDFDLIPRGHDWGTDYDNGWAPCHKFGYIKVKTGDNDPSIIGVSGGSWTQGPAVFYPPDGLGLGKNGRFIEGEWTTSENVAVLMNIYLIRDQVRFEFNIKNKATVTQSVGVQIQGAAYNPVQDSGWQSGPMFVSGFGNLEYGKVFSGTIIPNFIEKMNSIATPAIIGRNIMAGQDAFKPGRVAVGSQDHLLGVQNTTASDIEGAELEMWLEPHNGYTSGSYIPDPRVRQTNMGWAICFDRKTLAPGSSRKIVNYYGVGVADGAWTIRSGSTYDFDSAALAAQSIRALDYDTTDPLRESDYNPTTFDIKAYVNNIATDKGVYDLGDVNVSLLLPDGLQLASGKAVQSLGYISRDMEAGPAQWGVVADGTVSGALEYFVRAQDSVSGWNQIVSRKILVPATGTGTLKSGWQLISVPFKFSDGTPNRVFNKLSGQIFPQYWYLTGGGSGSYKPLLAVKPGQGFWAYATGGGVGVFELAADREIYGAIGGTQQASLNVELKPGWNLVGSPFVYPVYWGQVQFYNKSLNLALPLDKAVTSGWLSSTFFAWNADKSKYDYFSDPQSLLEPWKGYWIRAKKTITMVFTPLLWPGSEVSVPSSIYSDIKYYKNWRSPK